MSTRISAPTLAGLYQGATEKFGDLSIYAVKDAEGVYQTTTYREHYERGLALATALIALGLKAREHVGLLADNRPEWLLCDYGVILAGAADVPRGTDITENEIVQIIVHSDARFVFIEHTAMLGKFQKAMQGHPAVEKVILMDPKAVAPEGVLKLEDLIVEGRELRARGDRQAEERMAAVRPDDLFTIIYTSGTTGTPKGVQLTHANMASQIRNLPFDLMPGDRTLCILPVWHSYERVFEMIAISMGACLYYTSLRTIVDDLKTVRPTIMASAPRLWESIYQRLMARIDEAPPLRRRLFLAARFCTCRVNRAQRFFMGQELDMEGRSAGENLSRGTAHLFRWLALYVPYRVLDKIVLSKLREAVGCGDFRGTISGGGALQPHVDEFFNFVGIPVLEGYGLTETAPVLAVRTWKNLVIGTVGAFYPETQIRIVDLDSGEILYPNPSTADRGRGKRGEIHARGPQVMKGYYKDPEGTARVLKDGWFNTGDIGMVTFNDCLKILGRSKDTIVLLNGENVQPIPIESRLTHSPLIDHCMVVGQDSKHLGVLIVPSLAGFRAIGIEAETPSDIAQNKDAHAKMQSELRELISAEHGFKSFERIADFRFVPKNFENGDELTNTFKLKRHVITQKYSGLIEEMYPKTPV